MAQSFLFTYTICDDGLCFYDQTTGTDFIIDWKHCALLGLAFAQQSSVASVFKSHITYSVYIQEKTKSDAKKYALEWTTVLRDSFSVLDHDYSRIRGFLADQGVSYDLSELVPPRFFNELTDRNCIFAFVKGLVLQSIDEESAAFWASDGKLKVRFAYKAIADAVADFCIYAGLLPSNYEIGQDYTDDNYFIVFENDSELPKQNICEWLLDQNEGFFADVPKIENPRGNPEEEIEPPPEELPAVEGYAFDTNGIPAHNVYTYSGSDISFPEIITNGVEKPPEANVSIKYRRSDSAEWLTEPPTIRDFGSYSCVGRITPDSEWISKRRVSYLYFGLGVSRRKVAVYGEPRTITADGNFYTLENILASTVPGETDSGLASGDSIKAGFKFKQKQKNVGTFQVDIDRSTFDIGREVDGVWQSRLDNYEVEFLSGTLTIEEPSASVEVPQESFGFVSEPTTHVLEIPSGYFCYYLAGLRPIDFKHTCTINGLKFTVESCESGERQVDIYLLPDGEKTPSSQYCVFSGQPVISEGENEIMFSTAKSIVTGSCLNFAIRIDNVGSFSEPLVIKCVTYIDSGYADTSQGEVLESGEIPDYDNMGSVSAFPDISFVRNVESQNSRVTSFIDGLERSESTTAPIVGGMYQMSSGRRPSSVFCFVVGKNELPFFGSNLLSMKLKISSFVNKNTVYPTVVSVKYNMVNGGTGWQGTELIEGTYGFGSATIEGEPEDWIEIEYDKDAYGDFVTGYSSNAFWIFRIECASGMIDISNVLCQARSGSSSAGSIGFADSGFSLDTTTADYQQLAVRPVLAFEFGPEGSASSEPETAQKTTAVWFVETYSSDTVSFDDIQGNGFSLHGVELVEVNGSKWLKVDENSELSIGYSNPDGPQLSNTRKIMLSCCVYGENEGEIECDAGWLGLPISTIGNNPAGDIYRSFIIGLMPTQAGTDFECAIRRIDGGGALFFKDLSLVVDYIE